MYFNRGKKVFDRPQKKQRTIRKKPKLPSNKMIEKIIEFDSSTKTLQDMLDSLTQKNLDPKNVNFDCVDYDTYVFYAMQREYTQKEFQKIMTDYYKRLKEYEEWYEKNKDWIDDELHNRKQKKIKELEAKKKKAAAELEKIQQELKEIE